jgi:hypothetical protein
MANTRELFRELRAVLYRHDEDALRKSLPSGRYEYLCKRYLGRSKPPSSEATVKRDYRDVMAIV